MVAGDTMPRSVGADRPAAWAEADRVWRDEVGIAFAVLEPFRLKTAFQTVFAPLAGRLVAIGAYPALWPFRAGRRVSPDELRGALDADEAGWAVGAAPMLLALANADVLPPAFRLFLPLPPAMPGGDILQALALAAQERRIVAACLRPHAVAVQTLQRLRDASCEVMVDTASRRGLARLGAGDIASFGARALGQACRSHEARRDFLRAAAALKACQVALHARDLVDDETLALALEAEADFLQGPRLDPFRLAGSVDAFEPLALPESRAIHHAVS